MRSQQFRNTRTGEIVTQTPISDDIVYFEEVGEVFADAPDLADFGDAVLNILERDRDWNSTTFDAISAEAENCCLSETDKDGFFRRKRHDPEEDQP